MWKKDDSAGCESSFLVANRYAVTFALGTMGTVLVVFTCQIKNHENRPYGSSMGISHLASFPMIMLYFRKFV